MAAAFFRGTQIDQNVKFKDKDRQLIRETEWPAEFEHPVDLSKVSRLRSILLSILKSILHCTHLHEDVYTVRELYYI